MSDTALNKIIRYGTAAERAAFTPSPAAGSQVLYIWYETDNAPDTYVWNGSAWVQINSGAGAGITALTGEVTATGPGSVAATIANDAVTNAKAANMATQTIKGRTTAGTGDPEDLTATQATAVLNAFTGDSGAGGVKGLVPAPAAGDAAAGKYLKADGTFAVPPGSGGNITSTSAYASPPGSPASGDIWLPNNSVYALRYSGSAWVPWGPIFPLTLPDNSAFSTDLGTPTISTTNGSVYMEAAAAAPFALQGRYMTAPSTPYTIDMAIILNANPIGAASAGFAGLFFLQNSDGKIHGLLVWPGASGGTGYITSSKFASRTGSPTHYVFGQTDIAVNSLWFLRIKDDGVNRVTYISGDGNRWQQISSVGRTDYLTADRIGWVVNAPDASYPLGASLIHWKQT